MVVRATDHNRKIDCSPKVNAIKSLLTYMIQRQEVIKAEQKLVYEKLKELINSQFPKASAVIEWNDKSFTGSGSVLEAEGSVVVETLGNGSLLLVSVSIKGVSELVYSEDRAAIQIDKILDQLKGSFL